MKIMKFTAKKCLICKKQRDALVDLAGLVKSVRLTFKIELPSNVQKVCIKCHYFLVTTIEWNKSRPQNYTDDCFGCDSKEVLPNVDQIVQNLLTETNAIRIKRTTPQKKPSKSCTDCLFLLQTFVKYEQLLQNVLHPTKEPDKTSDKEKFSKQYATLRDFNIALWKIQLDRLDDMLSETIKVGSNKRKRVSFSNESKIKKAKIELVSDEEEPPAPKKPKISPAAPAKKATPTKKGSKPKPKPKASTIQKRKIFIKLKPKKEISYGAPHSSSRPLPEESDVEVLNKLFGIELTDFNIKLDKIDPTLHLSGRLAVVGMRPSAPQGGEFIGLDEEDVMQYTQNTTITCIEDEGTGEKIKSILVTDRTESPNTFKKKVKFCESLQVKIVENIDLESDNEEDEDEKEEEEDEEDDDDEVEEVVERMKDKGVGKKLKNVEIVENGVDKMDTDEDREKEEQNEEEEEKESEENQDEKDEEASEKDEKDEDASEKEGKDEEASEKDEEASEKEEKQVEVASEKGETEDEVTSEKEEKKEDEVTSEKEEKKEDDAAYEKEEKEEEKEDDEASEKEEKVEEDKVEEDASQEQEEEESVEIKESSKEEGKQKSAENGTEEMEVDEQEEDVETSRNNHDKKVVDEGEGDEEMQKETNCTKNEEKPEAEEDDDEEEERDKEMEDQQEKEKSDLSLEENEKSENAEEPENVKKLDEPVETEVAEAAPEKTSITDATEEISDDDDILKKTLEKTKNNSGE